MVVSYAARNLWRHATLFLTTAAREIKRIVRDVRPVTLPHPFLVSAPSSHTLSFMLFHFWVIARLLSTQDSTLFQYIISSLNLTQGSPGCLVHWLVVGEKSGSGIGKKMIGHPIILLFGLTPTDLVFQLCVSPANCRHLRPWQSRVAFNSILLYSGTSLSGNPRCRELSNT